MRHQPTPAHVIAPTRQPGASESPHHRAVVDRDDQALCGAEGVLGNGDEWMLLAHGAAGERIRGDMAVNPQVARLGCEAARCSRQASPSYAGNRPSLP